MTKKPKITAIVQARMGSTRLPGKVLKKVLDKPLLVHQLERIKEAQLLDEIVVATTTESKDQPIVDACQSLGIPVERGSVDDVLDRYYQTAKKYQADIIVRLTADCPLIDPAVIDQTVQFFANNMPEYDYVSNTMKRSFPRGMDIEVFSFAALEHAAKNAKSPSEREHVTPYIYLNDFKCGRITYESDQSHHRWTVDTAEDLILITKIIEALYPHNPKYRLNDILALLEKHPEWEIINAHIEQKKME